MGQSLDVHDSGLAFESLRHRHLCDAPPMSQTLSSAMQGQG